MLLPPAGTDASAVAGAPVYVRHRPERTLLYQITEEYLPEFRAHLSQNCIELPDFVEREFDAYLACGRLEHGFLRVRCEQRHAEQLVAFSCKKRGFTPGILPSALRVGLRPLKIAPGNFVAPVAVPGAWPSPRRCWSMRSYRSSRCASGC